MGGETEFGESAPVEETKADRRRRRKAEQLADDRPIEPWERYRALSDLVEHMFDIIEMADRRTRFALVILGALNALNVLLAVQSGRIGAADVGQAVLLVYVGVYVLLSLYFFVYAIEALRPRSRQMGRTADANSRHQSIGLRLIDDILSGTVDEFYDRWQQVEIGQLNRELAIEGYLLARTAHMKFAAMHQVYRGLRILVILTALLVVVLTLSTAGARWR